MAVRGLIDAVGVLTRVPVVGRTTSPSADLAAAAPWFPVVGALTGLVVGAAGVGAAAVVPVYVAAVLALMIDVLLTGALHLDGLADCADGTAGDSRERRLAIMKDHSVGVYGTTAVIFDLLLRGGCLAALLLLPPPMAMTAVAAAWTLSRAAMLPPALLLDYARADGTGRAVITGLTRRLCLVGLVLGGALVAALLVPTWGALAALVATIGAAAGAAAPTVWAWARLGGATGDVLGAVAEFALIGALLGLLVLT